VLARSSGGAGAASRGQRAAAMKLELFTCAVCGRECASPRPAAEVERERQELWAPEIAAGAQPADFNEVCHDCYLKIMQWFESESGIVRPTGS
jgi:hypothetical protein